MAQLNLKLSQEALDGLRAYAARRRVPVSWLIRDYVEYLVKGGAPVVPPEWAVPSGQQLAALAQAGGAFDWLRDEPEVYSLQDGEPL